MSHRTILLDVCSIDLSRKIDDTYNMNTDKDIVDDMQIRSLAYNLYRKYGRYGSTEVPIGVNQAVIHSATKWAEVLEMPEWIGQEAYRAWKDLM